MLDGSDSLAAWLHKRYLSDCRRRGLCCASGLEGAVEQLQVRQGCLLSGQCMRALCTRSCQAQAAGHWRCLCTTYLRAGMHVCMGLREGQSAAGAYRDSGAQHHLLLQLRVAQESVALGTTSLCHAHKSLHKGPERVLERLCSVLPLQQGCLPCVQSSPA